MFKTCVNCDFISVLVILSVGICSSLAIQDRERLHYSLLDDHHPSSDFFSADSVGFADDTGRHHHLVRRQIQQRPAQEPPLLRLTGDTANATQQDSTHMQNVDNRSGSEQTSSSVAPAVVRDNYQPPDHPQPPNVGNVGVNGTGIRWTNVSVSGGPSTEQKSPPPVISDPINPLGSAPNDTAGEFPADVNNGTLIQHNITRVESDFHDYYNSTFAVDEELGKRYWNELASPERLSTAQVSDLLSQSHRRAVTVQLTFDFPFYGHPVRNVTVATGGFLYTGDYVHSWLAATQYIAPLMANFDTSLSNDSFVKFYDNGTAFTVLWENVSLQDRPNDGSFTFSATLLDSGDIIFVYKTIPVLVEKIEDNKHPVKVGLSDAYIIDRTIFFARRKTIYEYHRVHFKQEDITNGTVIYLKALPTCVQYTDCDSCLTQSTGFTCAWCPATNRCSSGLDRYRQEWLSKGCNLTQIPTADSCPAPGTKGNNAAISTTSLPEDISSSKVNPNEATSDQRTSQHVAEPDAVSDDSQRSGSAVVVPVIIPIVLILCIASWLLYAYRNPHTKSGQMLIRYRPSQWSWRRGEARYTAATIHM